MNCEQARQLFDAYLDGELSGALATELGAHRLKCADCRRALALMEVSGHIIASDQEPVTLRGEFPDRLLACMEPPPSRWRTRFRWTLYITGPAAAAAVVLLAFLGVFDHNDIRRAGKKEYNVHLWDNPPGAVLSPPMAERGLREEGLDRGASSQRLAAWVEQAKRNINAKRKSGESLQKALNLTIGQLLDILEQAKQAPRAEDQLRRPDAVPAPSTDPATAESTEVEDL